MYNSATEFRPTANTLPLPLGEVILTELYSYSTSDTSQESNQQAFTKPSRCQHPLNAPRNLKVTNTAQHTCMHKRAVRAASLPPPAPSESLSARLARRRE